MPRNQFGRKRVRWAQIIARVFRRIKIFAAEVDSTGQNRIGTAGLLAAS
jgi:hypothetical protein